MRSCKVAPLAVLFLSWGAPSMAADIQLTFQSGRLSLTAIDATPQQILAEWARIGRTDIINADDAPDVPITLQIENMFEGPALDILLRSMGGYVTVLRVPAESSRSQYARIVVMATAPTRSASAAATDSPDALEDSDPGVRIQNLETWAQAPGDTLDPATYALVDPDESVRARAEALLEEVLARPRLTIDHRSDR